MEIVPVTNVDLSLWQSNSLVDDARRLVQAINKAGFQAYMVGGFVRDVVRLFSHQTINDNQPLVHDIDIATNMPMDDLKKAFRWSSNNGEGHGTILVHFGSTFEVTQFRVDGHYSDGRHPDTVAFTEDFAEDTARRDFTINSMGMDADGNIIDFHGGYEDIKSKVIRAVGDPERRFNEDALRMVRAIRFSAVFGYEIEASTMEAIRKCAYGISMVAMERIHAEICKVIDSGDANALFRFCRLLSLSGLPRHFDPNGYGDWHNVYGLVSRYACEHGSPEEYGAFAQIDYETFICMLFANSAITHNIRKMCEFYRCSAKATKTLMWFHEMRKRIGMVRFDSRDFNNLHRYPTETNGRLVTDLYRIATSPERELFVRLYPYVANVECHEAGNTTLNDVLGIIDRLIDRVPQRAKIVESIRKCSKSSNLGQLADAVQERVLRDAIGRFYLTDSSLSELVLEVEHNK